MNEEKEVLEPQIKKEKKEVLKPKIRKVKKEKIFFNTKIKKQLEYSIENDLPALLIGDTGCGKTSFVRELANKRGVKLIRVNLTGQTGVDEVLGKWIVKGKEMVWIDGPLITAMKEGSFIVFDEINMALPEILSALHSLLDDDKFVQLKEKENEVIYAEPGFRFFATMNPPMEYAGTKELNRAFENRFSVICRIDYSDKEAKIISQRTGINLSDAEKLKMFGDDLRKSKKEQKIDYICSTRDLINLANLIVAKFKPQEALQIAILNKIDNKKEVEAIEKFFELSTGNIVVEFKGMKVEINSLSEARDKFKVMADENFKIIGDLKSTKESLEREVASFRDTINKKDNIINDLKEKYIISEEKLSKLNTAKEGMQDLMNRLKIPESTITEVLGDK